MRKFTNWFAIVCIFIIMIVLAQFCCPKQSVQTDNIKINSSADNSYILKSESGILKLYKSNKLIKTYNISDSSLPLTDRDNLKSGIKLKNYEDVLKIIEDFDG